MVNHYDTVAPGTTLNLGNIEHQNGPFTLYLNGTPEAPITVEGGKVTGAGLQLTGQYFTVQNVAIRGGGLRIVGGLDIGPSETHHVTIQYCDIAQAGASVWVQDARRIHILDNFMHDHRMIVNDVSHPDNDYGAIAIMLQDVSGVLVKGNIVKDAVAFSHDYETDGAGIEFYNNVHDCIIRGNRFHTITGFEIGGWNETVTRDNRNVSFRNNLVYIDPEHEDTDSARPYTIHGEGRFGVNVSDLMITHNHFYNFGKKPFVKGNIDYVDEGNRIFYNFGSVTFEDFLEMPLPETPPADDTPTPPQDRSWLVSVTDPDGNTHKFVKAETDTSPSPYADVIEALDNDDPLKAIRLILDLNK